MGCLWKNCKSCEGLCLWARGMSRLFSDSNLEEQYHKRVSIDLTENVNKELSVISNTVKNAGIVLIQSDDKMLSTMLAIKFLQNYFNQVATEAGIDGMGVYVPTIDWIKKGLSRNPADLAAYHNVRNKVYDSQMLVWDNLGQLTDYQRDELNIFFYGHWVKGRGQVMTVFPDWKERFKGSAMYSLMIKARVVKL